MLQNEKGGPPLLQRGRPSYSGRIAYCLAAATAFLPTFAGVSLASTLLAALASASVMNLPLEVVPYCFASARWNFFVLRFTQTKFFVFASAISAAVGGGAFVLATLAAPSFAAVFAVGAVGVAGACAI